MIANPHAAAKLGAVVFRRPVLWSILAVLILLGHGMGHGSTAPEPVVNALVAAFQPVLDQGHVQVKAEPTSGLPSETSAGTQLEPTASVLETPSHGKEVACSVLSNETGRGWLVPAMLTAEAPHVVRVAAESTRNHSLARANLQPKLDVLCVYRT